MNDMDRRLTLSAALSFLALSPHAASAQIITNLFELMGEILRLLGRLVPVAIGIILIVIFWNLALFILKAGDEAEREKYKKFMVWSVVAMFLVLSFWGVVYFFVGSFFNLGDPNLSGPGFVDKDGVQALP